MTRFLHFCTLLLFAFSLSAQTEAVTTFLGIPIDGTKSEMIKKLKAKGYTDCPYAKDAVSGEFNGVDVNIYIHTNNNLVYRLCIIDNNLRGESQIKIRYNHLCNQFQNNSRYMIVDPTISDYSLSDNEDIKYEITVNDKQYQASYFQNPDTPGFLDRLVWFTIAESYGEYGIIMFYENLKNAANGEDL